MIHYRNVSKSFASRSLLRNVSLDISSGERVSLVGLGGCGKTTLLKMLLGLVPLDSGEILLMGQSITKSSSQEHELILKKVGMAFQQGGLFDFMTVSENLKFAMKHMTKFSAKEMDLRIKSLLSAVKLSRTENMYPHELSGGMKRRVGIARALCTDPKVAIFDEPTSGLDPVTSTIILNMILELSGQGKETCAVVATSHIEIAMRFADRLIILHEGHVLADGPWRHLLVHGSEWVRHFLGVRLIGLAPDYVKALNLPEAFLKAHWGSG